MIVQRKAPLLDLLPIEIFGPLPVLYHGDAAIDGTDQLAEIATHAFFLLYRIRVIRIAWCQLYGLM